MIAAKVTSCASAVVGFLATALLAGCGPIHEWPYVAENPYCIADFCVTLPGKGGASVKTSGDANCVFLDLIDTANRWYSVEWCQNKRLQSADAAAFYAFWDSFQSEYLQRNFGTARYEPISSSHVTLSDGRPGMVFAGSGVHNGGKKGALLVLATVVDGHAVNCYLLLDRQLPKNFAIVGMGRTQQTDDQFRGLLLDDINKFSRSGKADAEKWKKFA